MNVPVEGSLNISFQHSRNVLQEHLENIALERSKNRHIFFALGTFHERSNKTFRTFREGIVLRGIFPFVYSIFKLCYDFLYDCFHRLSYFKRSLLSLSGWFSPSCSVFIKRLF